MGGGNIIYIILSSIIIYVLYKLFYNVYETFDNVKYINKLYSILSGDYQKIFPDMNRNAGGVQFFEYIMKKNPTKKDFEIYTTFFCGVSGSLIDPGRDGIFEYVVLKDLKGNEIHGKYHLCCSPCLCDIRKYSRVEKMNIKLKDGTYPYYVITIPDPCKNKKKIPNEVSSFVCKNKKTQNGIFSPSGRLIINVLHDGKPYQASSQDMKQHFDRLLTNCKERNSMKPDELQYGMGDIFVKLSLIGKEGFSNDSLKNIYGDPLKPCQKYKDDISGSWDSGGYCSEKGGGVHQICFDVNKKTKDFAKETGQSGNWSTERVGKGHCMCLGAWALYKAKQSKGKIKKTQNELNCEAIPEMSLNNDYVSTWNTWNGNELPNQIVNGVNQIIHQCYPKGTQLQKKFLKQKYLSLTKNKKAFHSTKIYKKYK